jgi:hypothetical protein
LVTDQYYKSHNTKISSKSCAQQTLGAKLFWKSANEQKTVLPIGWNFLVAKLQETKKNRWAGKTCSRIFARFIFFKKGGKRFELFCSFVCH